MRYTDFKGLKALGIPYSRQHILRLEKLGRWPKRHRLNGFKCMWDVAEIEAYIASFKT